MNNEGRSDLSVARPRARLNRLEIGIPACLITSACVNVSACCAGLVIDYVHSVCLASEKGRGADVELRGFIRC